MNSEERRRLTGRKLALLIQLSDLGAERRTPADDVLHELLLCDPDCAEWLDAHPNALI
ncbi:MAG: hypothetical protein AB1450_13265 [Pseudomonadota bacterium]